MQTIIKKWYNIGHSSPSECPIFMSKNNKKDFLFRVNKIDYLLKRQDVIDINKDSN